MNTMNRLTNATKAQKITIIALSLLVIAVVVYGAAAFATRSWPFNLSTQVKTETPAKNPAMTMKKPIVNAKNDMLQVTPTVATKEQGTCKLTLSNKEKVIVITNSTEGVQGRTGCLDYNIGTSNIPAGTYDVEVKFVGKTQTSATKQTVTLP